MDISISKLTEILNEKNITPSYQRLKILQYLMKSEDHPTVEEIFTALHPEIPTLSKTTVYNTLNVFLEAGIVRMLNFGSTETRYDANLEEHGHFKCTECGRIYDFTVNLDRINAISLPGFVIKEKDVYLKGTCRDCNQKNKKVM